MPSPVELTIRRCHLNLNSDAWEAFSTSSLSSPLSVTSSSHPSHNAPHSKTAFTASVRLQSGKLRPEPWPEVNPQGRSLPGIRIQVKVTSSAYVEAMLEGITLFARELLHLGERAVVDQAFSRLVKRGKLMHVRRGLRWTRHWPPQAVIRPMFSTGRSCTEAEGRMRFAIKPNETDLPRPDARHLGSRRQTVARTLPSEPSSNWKISSMSSSVEMNGGAMTMEAPSGRTIRPFRRAALARRSET